MTDSYLTITHPAIAHFKVKGSKFIGQAFPVQSPEAAEDKISEVKREYHDATHNCSAYRMGTGDEALFYYDDDGEPSGTAGQPMFQVIEGRELTNVLVVVTRYFGGTKLGTGGLIRAYGTTAGLTLDNAEIVREHLQHLFHLHTTYEDIAAVMRSVNSSGGRVICQDYGEEIDLTVAIRLSRKEEFRRIVTDLTGGRIQFGK